MYLFLWQVCYGLEYEPTDKWCGLVSFLLYHHWGNIFTGNKVNNNLICCLILWDTLALCIHQKFTNHGFIIYHQSKVYKPIYIFFLQMKKKKENCMNTLIVYWMSYFHCNVYFDTCLCILQKCLIMWYLFIDSTWCSSMCVEWYFTWIKS